MLLRPRFAPSYCSAPRHGPHACLRPDRSETGVECRSPPPPPLQYLFRTVSFEFKTQHAYNMNICFYGASVAKKRKKKAAGAGGGFYAAGNQRRRGDPASSSRKASSRAAAATGSSPSWAGSGSGSAAAAGGEPLR